MQTLVCDASTHARTDVRNWRLIGWIKDDLQLDNPKVADDYISSIKPHSWRRASSIMTSQDVSRFVTQVCLREI